MEDNRIQLSVLDIENKYVVDPEETTYGNKSLVTWGLDNQLPVLYHNCYNKSATLKAIIDGTINYVLVSLSRSFITNWDNALNYSRLILGVVG